MDEENLKKGEEESVVLKWWKQRSELEKKLLISLGVAVLLILGMLLFSTIKSKASPKPCSTPDCLITAAQIISYVDQTIDPCDDFFKFACGKLIEEVHGDPEKAPRKELSNQIKRQMYELIEEPILEDDHYVLKSQKELFQGCMNETNGEESLRIFKEFLNEFNGWPVVVGSKWKGNTFDWTDAVLRLRRKGYNYNMMLNIEVIRDPRNLQAFIVYVSPPFVKTAEKEHMDSYKQFMTDVAVLFGAKQQRAEEDMEKVLDFREKLKELGVKYPTSFTKDDKSRLTVKEFQLYNYEIDWLPFLNDIMYPNKMILKSEEMIFPTTEFMDDFFDLIDRTPERIQANYIIWTALEHIIPLMSAELRKLQETYNYITKTETSWEDRLEFCIYLLHDKFFPVPSTIIYARKYLPAEDREQAQELLSNIKTEIANQLSEIPWMDEESKETSLEQLNGITEVVGTEGDYFDDAIFDQNDGNKFVKNLDGTNFLGMLLNASRNADDVLYSLIHISGNVSLLGAYEHNILLVPEVIYAIYSDLLILPVAFLEGSFYSGRPKYMNYAAAGSRIVQELTENVCRLADDDIQNLWSKQTQKSYLDEAKCAFQEVEQAGKLNTLNLETRRYIARITGPKLAYMAYNNWVAENGEEEELVGIDYSNHQLFWIAAALHQCSQFDEEDIRDISENYETKESHIIAFAKNNDDFANDFNCPANSPMNPSDKCQVF